MDLECEGKAGVGIPELTWIHTHKTAALLKVGVTHKQETERGAARCDGEPA
jgi:hypothetical protein